MKRFNKAVVLGISNYENAPIEGAAEDAARVATLLSTHETRERNFGVNLIQQQPDQALTSMGVLGEVRALFSEPCDIALFYFAGHGWIDPQTNRFEICVSDGERSEQFIRLSDIIDLVETADKSIRSKIVILDCCFAGAAAHLPGLGGPGITHIPDGTTILAAATSKQAAESQDGSGVFSNLLIDALEGGAADILGRVTPASVYTHIDQALGPNHQRPVYMANVREFITLRQTTPSVDRSILFNLVDYFPDSDGIFPLDPTFEPDRKNVPEEFRDLPVNDLNTAIFKDLQICNRNGLIVPHNADHMYDAAINSTGCRLTRMGKHFHNLAMMGEI